jgi:hypothetical protein
MGSKTLQVIFPDSAVAALADAAKHSGVTLSAFIRQASYGASRALGFDPTAMPSDGGAGVQQWALVVGDEVKSLHQGDKLENEQGGRWLPVVYQDSGPFDPELHCRLAPWIRVEASRVIRTYFAGAKPPPPTRALPTRGLREWPRPA